MARFIIIIMLLFAAGLGGFLYYQQVYAYYEEVGFTQDAVLMTRASTGEARPIVVNTFDAIDATSSPLRYRACFQTPLRGPALAQTYVTVADAEPRVAPRWFDCFDAREIGTDLQSGAVTAFMGIENVQYGIDRIVAIYPDGRGYAWHQINACGEVVFDGNRPPDDCPPIPESTE